MRIRIGYPILKWGYKKWVYWPFFYTEAKLALRQQLRRKCATEKTERKVSWKICCLQQVFLALFHIPKHGIQSHSQMRMLWEVSSLTQQQCELWTLLRCISSNTLQFVELQESITGKSYIIFNGTHKSCWCQWEKCLNLSRHLNWAPICQMSNFREILASWAVQNA